MHGEMFPLVHSDKPNPLRILQIWLNFLRKSKIVKPSFAMFWAENVHVWKSEDGKASVNIWAGNYFGRKLDEQANNAPPSDSWAADPENDVAIFNIKLAPGGKLVIPKANKDGVNRTMYLVEGHENGVKVDSKAMKENVYLELDATREVTIELPPSANNDDGNLVQTTEFLILQGKPINEPVAQHGPFVMNTKSTTPFWIINAPSLVDGRGRGMI